MSCELLFELACLRILQRSTRLPPCIGSETGGAQCLVFSVLFSGTIASGSRLLADMITALRGCAGPAVVGPRSGRALKAPVDRMRRPLARVRRRVHTSGSFHCYTRPQIAAADRVGTNFTMRACGPRGRPSVLVDSLRVCGSTPRQDLPSLHDTVFPTSEFHMSSMDSVGTPERTTRARGRGASLARVAENCRWRRRFESKGYCHERSSTS